MNRLGDMGVVFNIQHYCIHDGPGIRTNVFLKGCPLRCQWCANPESQELHPQLMYRKEKCCGCMRCVEVCPVRAIVASGGKVKTDRALCTNCEACIVICPADAREITGKMMTADAVYEEVAAEKMFYDSSGGGITLTGGELLSQSDFARVILQKCKQNGIGTAIETTGYAKWDVFRDVLTYTDIVLYDLKHMDSTEHKRGTGVGNTLMLQNMIKVSQEAKLPVIARVPVISGYNNTEENFHAMGQFLAEQVLTCQEVDLLPYHRLGEAKFEQLEKADAVFHGCEPDNLERLREILKTYGLMAK